MSREKEHLYNLVFKIKDELTVSKDVHAFDDEEVRYKIPAWMNVFNAERVIVFRFDEEEEVFVKVILEELELKDEDAEVLTEEDLTIV